jgi:transcriptional regulator with XRE-family HTH domain
MIERIKNILEKYNLTPSEFADKLELNRSNISHIFSGRNKPSLDFILKIYKCFPKENLYWILTGKEEKNQEPLENKENNLVKDENSQKSKNKTVSLPYPFMNSFDNLRLNQEKENQIEQIVIFFKDGSFKNYRPK